MQLQNRTHYNTRDLWRLFMAGLKAANADMNKCIEVVYARSARHSGYAYIGTPPGQYETPVGDKVSIKGKESNWIKICLPKDPTKLDVKVVAQIFVHEVQHTQGYTHRDMADCFSFPVLWAQGISIGVRQAARKLTPAERAQKLVAARERQAKEKVRHYEEALRRTEALLAKWSKKLAYYERRAAQAARSDQIRIASAPPVLQMGMEQAGQATELLAGIERVVANGTSQTDCADGSIGHPTLDRAGVQGERRATVSP